MFNLHTYYNSDKLRLFYSENICNDYFVQKLDNISYVFLQFTWNIEAIIKECPWGIEDRFKKLNPAFDFKKQFIFCAPDHYTDTVIKSLGYNSILVNHNCFLKYDQFNINRAEETKYNAVINSRPFWWKRVFLAENIEDVAYICGSDWANDDTSWRGYKDYNNFTTFNEICPDDVNRLYNESMCGMILSGNTGENQQGLCEGANYSSSEYLLSGLPVITTPNQGGRNYWLNDSNSITVEPSSDTLPEAVETVKLMLELGKFDRLQIREDFIKQSNKTRKTFNNKVQELFNESDIDLDASDYFDENYIYKMTLYEEFPDEKLDQIFK